MPTVWMRENPKHLTRFHRTPDCRQLRKKPAQGDHRELVEVDLEEVFVRPCRTCYPDAPAIKLIKAYCPICDSKTPCQHNGGVQIVDRRGRNFWVWPNTNQMPLYRRTTTRTL
jgi:hypothetical protein